MFLKGGLEGYDYEIIEFLLILGTPRKNCKPVAVIFVHNHLNGIPNSNEGDLAITKKLNEVATIIKVSLHGHIII